jgi:hypothetical protein
LSRTPSQTDALSYKTRKRLSILILLVGLPLYIVVAVNVVEMFDGRASSSSFLIWVALGILWALPLKAIFKGVGQADPDAPPRNGPMSAGTLKARDGPRLRNR